jgi:PIN domain nuclease of toxin-antitoxin system
MNLLLDTSVFLWVISDPTKLSEKASRHFQDSANTCYLSTVSTWEITVLHSLGRLQFAEAISILVPRERRQHRIRSLQLSESASLFANHLPPHHADPFDRMLICQALAHDMSIVTPDPHIAKYSAPVIW